MASNYVLSTFSALLVGGSCCVNFGARAEHTKWMIAEEIGEFSGIHNEKKDCKSTAEEYYD